MDERPPLVLVPIHVLQSVLRGTGLTAKQHHHRVGLGRDEAQDEDVPRTTGVALQYRLTQRTVFVKDYLLIFRPDQMIDDVRAASVAASIAKPLLGGGALDEAGRVGDAAVGASGRGRRQCATVKYVINGFSPVFDGTATVSVVGGNGVVVVVVIILELEVGHHVGRHRHGIHLVHGPWGTGVTEASQNGILYK